MSQEILRMEHIHKRFPGVYALNDVSFDLRPGEIHSLVGENGAGKSTLMNVLMGMHVADEGDIYLNGVKTKITSPAFAIHNSIGMVPQELNIIPDISVAENIFLGIQNRKNGIIDWKKTYEKAAEIMDELGAPVDVRAKARDCNMAQLQLVQIGRTLAFGAKILILDEPTASLTFQEIRDLFGIIRKLKESGHGIIFISHHMDEVEEISDRVTVMRDGKKVDTMPMSETSISEMIDKMAGQKVVLSKFDRGFTSDDVILEVEDLTLEPLFRNVSFSVKRGEILGVGGLVGAGRTEVMRAVFGDFEPDSGIIRVNGKEQKFRRVQDAIDAGIGYLPEERRAQAIFPVLSVRENLTMPILNRLAKSGRINKSDQKTITEKYVQQLEIKTPSIEKEIKDLSGGNQQKVIFGRWIEKDLDILILDEPTRGIDVRAKDEIHKLIHTLAEQGKTIIVISSETEELINIADRIMVMNEGKVRGFLDTKEASANEILSMALS